MRMFAAALLAGILTSNHATAIGPQDICILYNKNLPNSKSVAEYYCQRRGVPVENMIPLDVPDVDQISRDEYEKHILLPVRVALKGHRPVTRVLLTVYGMPLRIGEQPMSDAEKAALDKLKPEIEANASEIRKLNMAIRMWTADVEKDPTSPSAAILAERQTQLKAAEQKRHVLDERGRQLIHAESTASVDSELMLLWWPPYPLTRWVFNPLYWQVSEEKR
jgi:uncharacterized protein (TIGR03790 family)